MNEPIPLVDLKAQYNSIQAEVDFAIQSVLDSCQFINGPKTKQFADNFAKYCGARYCLGTSSGTTAITLALIAAGIKAGDEIITTPFTFIATTEAICEAGAVPVYVDISEETGNIEPSKIESAITKRTKAIITVHLYGLISGMNEINSIAAKHNLLVIEDAAQAHGATYHGKKAPVIHTAAYSFYPGKTLGAYGDAGAIVTNDSAIFEQASMLLDHGRKKGEKYRHESLGYNFRIDEMQAAILDFKLKHLDEWVQKRRAHAALYNRLLRADIRKVGNSYLAEHGMYVYVIRTANRDELFAKLKENGVSAVIHYPEPLHCQPALRSFSYAQGDFPVAEKYAREVLSLPLYPELSTSQIERVSELVNRFAK